jgi:hypothetical protein
MAASLRTIEATVTADGGVTLAEPVTVPCKAVVTLLVEEWIPNPETIKAMEEPTDDLPCYSSAEKAIAPPGI